MGCQDRRNPSRMKKNINRNTSKGNNSISLIDKKNIKKQKQFIVNVNGRKSIEDLLEYFLKNNEKSLQKIIAKDNEGYGTNTTHEENIISDTIIMEKEIKLDRYSKYTPTEVPNNKHLGQITTLVTWE